MTPSEFIQSNFSTQPVILPKGYPDRAKKESYIAKEMIKKELELGMITPSQAKVLKEMVLAEHAYKNITKQPLNTRVAQDLAASRLPVNEVKPEDKIQLLDSILKSSVESGEIPSDLANAVRTNFIAKMNTQNNSQPAQ